MRRSMIAASVILCLVMTSVSFAQSTNASLGGTVLDAAGAVVEDAVVTAKNIRTGVIHDTKSNGQGVYLFVSLQPGLYEVTAEKPGFNRFVYNEVLLEVAAKAKLDFQMETGGVTESVSVSAGNQATLNRESTSVTGVINEQMITDLPLPARDALGLVLTQGGLLGDNFGGQRIGALSITRDGIDVMDRRINSGINSTVFNSVDLVQEVRVTTSPADAEFGRGSAFVQLITRSGTNEFHGSLFESHRNTALNANEWDNNLRGDPRDQLIRNQFGGRIGGPIRKNKTFFFFLYEGQRQRAKGDVTATVLTQAARQGVFRFFPGALNGNALAITPTVDASGNPVRPATATGNLQSANLFGRDPNRSGFDPTGLVPQFLDQMPLPNNFRVGDGLNTAGFTWSRPSTDDFNNYNVRIDHNFNENHRLNYSYSNERSESLNGFLAPAWPSVPGGTVSGDSRFHSLQFVSSFGPRIVNEFYAGAQRPLVRFFAPWELNPDIFPTTVGGTTFAPDFNLVSDPINIGNDPQGRISPVYMFGDKISFLKGRHSFKGGAEVRFTSTNGFNSFTVLPRAVFGTGGVGVQRITGSNGIPGIGLNGATAQNLLILLSGSISSVQQAFNSAGGADPDFIAGEGKRRTWKQREFSLFFKDDFKVKPNLTLNLGLRYEFYGVPFEDQGKAAGLKGGSAGIFGISGSDESTLFRAGAANSGSLTDVVLVGPGSPNESQKLYNNDWNNFAPSIGVSWALPWFGQDKTVLRAGYGLGYEKNSLRIVDVVAGDQPGLRTVRVFTQPTYLNLAGVNLPLTPLGEPLSTIPLTDRTQTVRAFDANLRTPYSQNWSVSIQRDLGWRAVAEVRYVGSKGTKLIRGANFNEVNIFETGILDAFLITQAGGDAPLLDRIFMGLNIPGFGVVNGTTRTGSGAVRFFSTTSAMLANNNVGAFASFLNSTTSFTGVAGGLLRRAGLPENFIVVNPQFAGANLTGNFANSSYHSLQLDVTKRFTNGLQFQSNYTWSKSLGEEDGSGQEMLDSYRTARDRSFEKRRLGFDIRHVFRSSWTYELPFGPRRAFVNGNNKIISRLVSNWQIGGIFNAFSGDPLTVGAGISSFNQFTDNTATVVGPFPSNIGRVVVTGTGVSYFGNLSQIVDPQVANLTTNGGVQGRSGLLAITDANGKLLLVNPSPGTLGTLAPAYIEGPGSFRFDVNLVKRIRLMEGKNIELRATALNVLNHPIWNNPNTDINSTNFGVITTAGGNRIMVLDLRFNF